MPLARDIRGAARRLAGSNAPDVMLYAVAALATACLIWWFWPGSIGWDFQIILREAASGQYAGHQPPNAAIATRALSFGTSAPSFILVVKVLGFFGALAFLVWRAGAPLPIKLGGAALTFSPVFFYLAPLLRGNALEMVFAGLAISAGLSRSVFGVFVSSLSFILAVMFASAPHPGHIALLLLYFLWHFPGRSPARQLRSLVTTGLVLSLPLIALGVATRHVDRSSTLYVSALNGIGGLVKLGVESCLGQDLVRGTTLPADRVFADHYDYPTITPVIWNNAIGFEAPHRLSLEQRQQAVDCWMQLIRDNPSVFVRERIGLATLSLLADGLEPQFVFRQDKGDFVLQPHPGEALTDGSRVIIDYARWGAELGLSSFLPYLLFLLLTSSLVLWKAPGFRLFSVTGLAAVAGFCAPQLLAGQSANFRYLTTPAYLAAWIGLLQVWIVIGRRTRLARLGSPAGQRDQ